MKLQVAQRRGWPKEVPYLVLLLVAVTLFHWRGIRPGHTFLPVDVARNNLPWRGAQLQPLQNWLISDPLYQYYPFLEHGIRAVRDLRWPLWNADIMLGHPSLADPLGQPFYPLVTVAGLVFGPARGLAVAGWFHALLAAGLTYGWLRYDGRRSAAAVGGALIYALSGYMVTWFETPFWVGTLSLLTGIMWALGAAARQRRCLYIGAAGFLFGLALLAGQFSFMVAFTIFLGLYVLGRWLAAWRDRKRTNPWWLISFVFVVLIGVLIGAVAILPFRQMLALSRRVITSGLQDPLPVQNLITLLVPNYFGNPATTGTYWGVLNFSEGTIYAGLVALFLAFMAPITDRRFFVGYLALLTLGIGYAIVGGPGISLFGSVPVLKYISLHRSAFILPLLIAYLAATTLDAPKIPLRAALASAMFFAALIVIPFLLDVGGARAHQELLLSELGRAVALLLITLVLVWIQGRMVAEEAPVTWMLAGLIFLDLFSLGRTYNPVGKIADLMPTTPAIEYLQANVRKGRLMTLQRNDEVMFGPNVPSVFGIAEAGGYSSLINERYYQLVRAGDPELDVWWMDRASNMVTFSDPSLQLMDLFQVSHVASPEPLPDFVMPRGEVVNEACDAATATVGSEQILEGSFTVRTTAVNRLDLRVSISPENVPTGQLFVTVRQGDRLVLQEAIDATALQDRQVLTFFFAAEREAPGRRYLWQVSGDHPATGVALCRSREGDPAVSVYGNEWLAVYDGEINIYERLAPLPRAYVVYGARPLVDDEEVVTHLLDPAFPLRHRALTAEPVDLPAVAPQWLTPAAVVSYEDTRVIVQVDAVAEGLLVLGDQYYPGWEAQLDGKQVPIVRTNHIFRGVRVPPGEHEVIFAFRPRSVALGLAITLAAVFLVTALVVTDLNFHRVPRNAVDAVPDYIATKDALDG